jgi:hypothetical protein
MCQVSSINELGCKDPLTLKINQRYVIILRKLKIPLLIRKLKKYNSLIINYLTSSLKNFTRDKESLFNASYFFKPGDVIRICSKDQILKTLDKNNKLEGCVFMNEMWQYCGSRQKILKKVEFFFDECQFRMRKTRNVVILEGLHCSGKIPAFKQKCDRFCYFFWKEAWLEKIE